MAKPTVDQISVDLTGQPDNRKKKAKPAEAVVWTPESELETITVTFLGGKTPFCTDVLQAPCRGGCVGALVIGPDDSYKYQISVDGVRIISSDEKTGAADPEIIIDSGSEIPPKSKKGSSKAVQKKSAAKRPAGVKKAGAVRKAAKKKTAKKR
jgi:hypothetical protein